MVKNNQLILLFLCILQYLWNQNVYAVNYSLKSDIKVYVVEYFHKMTKIFKVDYKTQAKGN